MTQHPTSTTPQADMSRRDFLSLAWGAAGALTLAVGGVLTFQFFAPKVVEGEFGGVFTVGKVDDFPPNSVTPIINGRFYVVRLADGGFLALYQRCTHLGCAVPWNPEQGKFVCPCHGSAFEQDGQVLNTPAPRPLDRFAVSLANGQVRVDTAKAIQRDVTAPTDAVYA